VGKKLKAKNQDIIELKPEKRAKRRPHEILTRCGGSSCKEQQSRSSCFFLSLLYGIFQESSRMGLKIPMLVDVPA